MSESCFICNKHKGDIQTSGVMIYEDEFVYVGHIDKGGKPSYLGHIMIDLKRHAPSLGDMTFDEAKAFGVIMARVSKAIKETENAEHIYAAVSGNSVPHLHMHIIPRYPNTPEEYWGPWEVYDWPEAPFGKNAEIIKVCERIKSYLEENPYE
ncbi:HIT family protein [Fictibacillus halophilus]|uniref:HIT family protein n=1 Tax=Fictibacillus halophilus TaxID=1610490 RepID=UPI003637E840